LRAEPENDNPTGQGGGGSFTTRKNMVLLLPQDKLTALFKDPDGGDKISAVTVATQPEAAKGFVVALPGAQGSGLQFVPAYKATGATQFEVVAKDATGAPSSSVAIKVDVLGERPCRRQQRVQRPQGGLACSSGPRNVPARDRTPAFLRV
jgi:hypothetical protein